MEKKKASALASLLMILLASFALAAPIPPAHAAAENHKYWVMGGMTNSDGQLGTFDAWYMETAYPPGPVPFASRPPLFTPLLNCQNITFTDKDPVTGIVELAVPQATYIGLNHTYFSGRVGYYFNVEITLDNDGCGWIYTGIGTSPVLGSVDYKTYGNDTGVYTYGPDQTPQTGDDELLAGQSANPTPPPDNHAGGSGPPIGPCLGGTQSVLRGTDDIPGTADDPIGRGDPDGADHAGSSILYLPTTMTVRFFFPGTQEWRLLFQSPWPQLLTTGTAHNKIIEPNSAINGEESQTTGHAWEFFSGEDSGTPVAYGHPKWNEYVTYVAVWSVCNIDTALGDLDVHYMIEEKKVKVDPEAVPGPVIADINCDEVCNIIDIVMAALSFDAKDESFGVPAADPNYDPRGDVKDPRGLVNIIDIVRIALDFDERLEP